MNDDTTETAAPIYAIVTEAFEGCRDGEFQPTAFAPGDALEGEIAAAGIKMGKAATCSAEDFREARVAAAAAAPASEAEPTLEGALHANNRLRMALDDVTARNVELNAELDEARRHIAMLQDSLAAAQKAAEELKAAMAAGGDGKKTKA